MPEVSVTDPSVEPESINRWRHLHLFFMLFVFTNEVVKIYKDKQTYTLGMGDRIESWNRDAQTLAIEEGRRQLDAQFAGLQHVTNRASVLLPVGIVISGFVLSELRQLDEFEGPNRVLAQVGLFLTLWGVALVLAIIAASPRKAQTDAVLLTREDKPWEYLAQDYAEAVSYGENALRALRRHLATAIIWIVVGAVLGAWGLWVSSLA